MGIFVYSPYSGAAVKIRTEDVGRSVKDPDGRIFYVVAKDNGGGYYAAKTRKGSDEDLALALSYEEHAALHPESTITAHDATGQKRSVNSGKLFVVLLGLVCVGVLILFLAYGNRWFASGIPANEISTGQKQRERGEKSGQEEQSKDVGRLEGRGEDVKP